MANAVSMSAPGNRRRRRPIRPRHRTGRPPPGAADRTRRRGEWPCGSGEGDFASVIDTHLSCEGAPRKDRRASGGEARRQESNRDRYPSGKGGLQSAAASAGPLPGGRYGTPWRVLDLVQQRLLGYRGRHPDALAAMKRAVGKCGAGSGRFAHHRRDEPLPRRVGGGTRRAARKEDAVLFASGYSADKGALPVLSSPRHCRPRRLPSRCRPTPH